ncbi:hypothetical protein OIV83_004346 [Microbotryomycetes sp. JL201]|nr:hypothetical protein OIV83_004279 [Microbotryomycetes sp. JL201]KAK4049197.1 hypothetical protein OIV83_004346 [Microbotryomycetes sp. JL201]
MVKASHALENAFGTLGAVFWSIQLIPQIWKTWRRSSTEGLSTTMMLIWYTSGIFLGAYNVAQGLSIPLQIQPQCFTFLAAITTAQGLHYDYKWSSFFAWAFLVVASAFAGGVEVGLVFAAYSSDRARQAWGVLAAIFIVAGLLPQYWEVYKLRAVIGISFIFLTVDLLGGVFSLLSIVYAPPPFDVLASISYSALVAVELGIFVLAPILNPPYYRRKRTEEAMAERQGSNAKDRVEAKEKRDEEEAGHVSTAAARRFSTSSTDATILGPNTTLAKGQ